MPDDAPKSHPTDSRQAVIDRQGTALVEGWLARHWIVQRQTPNNHEDYIIERLDAGEYSGAKVSVQQKGHATVRFADGYASEVMETKHLRYFAEKVRMPVFLFVVDVTAGRGYYLFLQEWLDRNVEAEKLRNRKKLTVKVALSHSLADPTAFVSEANRALHYMTRKHPGTVEDAMGHDVAKMAAIDPRFHVSLDVVNSRKQYTFRAKTNDVKASLKLSGPNVERMRQLLEYGKGVHLDATQATVSGLPLIERLQAQAKKGVLSILPKNAPKLDMTLWTSRPDGLRMNLSGIFTRGSLGGCFTAELPESPLRIELTVSTEVLKSAGMGRFDYGFHFDRWQNRPVNALPYFDTIEAFVQAIQAKETILQEITERGNRVTRGHLGQPTNMAPFEFASEVLDNLKRARELAEKLGIKVLVPSIKELTPERFEAVRYAHDIMIGNGQQIAGVSLDTEVTLNRDGRDPAELVAELEQVCGDGVVIVGGGGEAELYGVRIALPDIAVTIKPTRATIPEPGRAAFLNGSQDSVPMRIQSLAQTTATITRADP